ncbi:MULTISPECIES: ABC transporter ATP-binding protein [Ochrobactrum]|uniref:ABC transporter ATP-binding protein n=1 Tax=Ochrobactrum TaxID=528 RepID=UPI00298A05D1|nr:ABC transporter ATP-binding protein [Ochrobactrum sp. AN78]MDH7792013.1 putative spermidine/putrescine transport system ATP-binding protein [Ochrobactrum sp. AN78]
MVGVQIQGLTKTYGAFRAVSDMTLDVHEGEFLIFLGPSGCGKTTTLRMLAGFIEPDAGTMRLGSREITYEPPYRRNIGLVFQNYALFPHLSIFENVAFGLRRRRVAEPELKNRVRHALELVDLAHLMDRLPKQLSGGQQQRVAIARAIAIRPDMLLLDEPLSNLDARLRLQVRDELRSLQKTLGITTIMVTHDQEEAMSVGDRLVLMRSGVIEQIGSAEQLYKQPSNRFVADFIGRANFLTGQATDSGSFTTNGGVRFHAALNSKTATEVLIRPEALRLSKAPLPSAQNSQTVIIKKHVFLGGMVEIDLVLPDGQHLTAVASPRELNEANVNLVPENSITISIAPEDVVLL